MGVVGIAAAETDALHPRERITQFAAHVGSAADQIDGRGMAMAVLMVMIVVVTVLVVVMAVSAAMQVRAVRVAGFVFMAMARQAVGAVLLGVGDAQIAARPDP